MRLIKRILSSLMICYKNLIKWNFMSNETGQTIKADNRPIVIITQIMKKNYLKL